jgi:DNA-binding response OmpR family regulator
MQQVTATATTRVLCVDDDTLLTDLLQYALTSAGYAVQIAHTGVEALQRAQSNPPDVAIVDVNLPDRDGFTLCSSLRHELNIPVIMMTARRLEPDLIAGFEHGADDYITKPFNMKILMARLRTVLTRDRVDVAVDNKKKRLLRLGPALFNAEFYQILAGSQTIKLTRTEGSILELLMSHEGQVFTPERLIEEARGYDTETSPAVIKTHILNLRSKIARAIGDVQVIHTVPGLGYRYQRSSQPAGGSQERSAPGTKSLT